MSYEEQIMSKDKYPSIFSPQMEPIVIIIHQIFYVTRAVLKIGEYPRIFPSFFWEIFAHVTRFDQSRARENICWIIIRGISVSLLRPVIGSNVEIDVVALNWVADVRKQIAAGHIHISLQVQQYLLKIRLLTVIIKLLYHRETLVQMVCLYNTSNLTSKSLIFF